MYLAAEPLGFAVGALLLRLRPQTRDGEPVSVFAVVAGVSAIGAVVSGGSPTGWAPLDVVLLAVLGAGAVFDGTFASRRCVDGWRGVRHRAC